ncbi:SET domain-containing protein [Meredithblackwellia eburnea MCA 4105]
MDCSQTRLGHYLLSPTDSTIGFNKTLVFKQDPIYGTSIFSKNKLEKGSTIVSASFDTAITPNSSKSALKPLTRDKSLAHWSDHQLIATYLALYLDSSFLTIPEASSQHWKHAPYVELLPKPADLTTPSYWTEDERLLLQGTNLAPAVLERQKKWEMELEGVREWLRPEVGELITWDAYLWASTMLSSRAFPSNLLHVDSTSMVGDPTPVLLPGIDMLNHSNEGVKVSWVSDVVKRTMAIVIDEDVPADYQVFNTYGAKSNEELILGYGFHIPSNRSDTVFLKLSLPPPTPTPPTTVRTTSTTISTILPKLTPELTNVRHAVPRSGVLPEELVAQMRLFLATDEERGEIVRRAEEDGEGWGWESLLGIGKVGWENEMDVLSALEGMLESKVEGLRRWRCPGSGTGDGAGGGVRKEVLDMVLEYRRSQVEILDKALENQQVRMEAAIEQAAAEGVDLGFDDIEEEEEEG